MNRLRSGPFWNLLVAMMNYFDTIFFFWFDVIGRLRLRSSGPKSAGARASCCGHLGSLVLDTVGLWWGCGFYRLVRL
jgi:hypothetical protein